MAYKLKYAAKDFLPENLPKTRREQFFDCLKHRRDLVYKNGLILLFSFLPLLALSLFSLWLAGNVKDAAGTEEYMRMYLLLSVAQIPGIVLFGLGFAAVSRPMREFIHGEPLFFREQWGIGFKQNALPFSIIFFLFALIRFFCTWVALRLPSSTVAFILPIAALLVLFPIGLFMLSLTIFYNANWKNAIKTAIALSVRSSAMGFLFSLLAATPMLLSFLPSPFAVGIVSAIAVFLFLPLGILAWMLISVDLFDRLINATEYPEAVGRGLYRPAVDKLSEDSPK